MSRRIPFTEKFTYYDTAEACADAAAPVFREKRWRWSRCGIPSREQILETLLYLQKEGGAASGRLIYHEGRFGHERLAEKFDRLTFDPERNPSHTEILRRLRQHGSARRFYFDQRDRHPQHHRPGHFNCCASLALRALRSRVGGWGVFADLGCGNSADAGIAAESGMLAYGVDLFPPDVAGVSPETLSLAEFRRGDVASRIPLPDGLVTHAISQAAVDLIEPEARPKFYGEVSRILAPGGLFVLNVVGLHHGHGVTYATEKRRCVDAGLKYADYFTSAMIFTKAIDD